MRGSEFPVLGEIEAEIARHWNFTEGVLISYWQLHVMTFNVTLEK